MENHTGVTLTCRTDTDSKQQTGTGCDIPPVKMQGNLQGSAAQSCQCVLLNALC